MVGWEGSDVGASFYNVVHDTCVSFRFSIMMSDNAFMSFWCAVKLLGLGPRPSIQIICTNEVHFALNVVGTFARDVLQKRP